MGTMVCDDLSTRQDGSSVTDEQETSAEDDVSQERIAGLNERFYSGDPAAYFRTRILATRALLPVDGALSDSAKTLAQAARLDEPGLARHVAIESQLILHHVAEAVLRMYIGHGDDPDCPWLRIASETNFRSLKDRVAAWKSRAPLLDHRAAWVFIGSAEAPDGQDINVWRKAAQNVTAFLHKFASIWIEQSHLYNSLKHGMAVTAGENVIQISADGGAFLRLVDGMAIEYLESEPWADGRRSWRLTTQWISTQEALDLSGAGCRMLESAWELARWRYLDSTDDTETSVWLPDFGPAEVAKTHAKSTTTMLDELR